MIFQSSISVDDEEFQGVGKSSFLASTSTDVSEKRLSIESSSTANLQAEFCFSAILFEALSSSWKLLKVSWVQVVLDSIIESVHLGKKIQSC